MLGLWLDSLEDLTLDGLAFLLVAIAAFVAVIVMIGIDYIIIAIALRYAFAIFKVLGRRAWSRLRDRLCVPK